MLSLLQDASTPGWVGPTMAISLVVVALAFVLIALAAALAARQAAHEMRQLSRVVESLRADLGPALGAMHGISSEGQRLAGLISTEAEELVKASRTLREGVRERIANLGAIYEVLEEEVEEAALDLAVTLRRVRTGAGWFGRLRRLLSGRRRR
ncbi:MAG TPA: hypothetical protein VH879_09055 [Gemmatimonadales bacterium]